MTDEVYRRLVIQAAHRDFEMATARLEDMRYRHRAAFEEFIGKYAADLPAEFLASLKQAENE